MKRGVAALAALLCSVAAGGLELAPGDLVVADPDARGVFLFDLVTGVADPIPGSGDLPYPSGVAVEPLGDVFVADPDANAIYRIDPTDGTRTLVCEGAPFLYPTGVAALDSGALLVADPVANAIFAIAAGDCDVAVLLSGPPMRFPTGVRTEPGGELLVVDPDLGALLRFAGGPHQVVSEGAPLRSPRGVALDGADRLVVDPVADGVYRVSGGVATLEIGTESVLFATDVDATPLPEPDAALGGLIGTALMLGLRSRRTVALLRYCRQPIRADPSAPRCDR